MFRALAAAAAVLLFAPAAEAVAAKQAAVKSMTITPANPRAGEPVTVSFTLKTPAPAGGTDVHVRYRPPWANDGFTLPDEHVIVPAGQTSGSAQLPVHLLPRTYQPAKIYAHAGDAYKTFTIQGRPDDGLYRIESWTGTQVYTFSERYTRTVTFNRPTPPEGLVLGRIERIIPGGVTSHTIEFVAPSLDEWRRTSYGGGDYWGYIDDVFLGPNGAVPNRPFSRVGFPAALVPSDRPLFLSVYGLATEESPLLQAISIGERAPAAGEQVYLTVSDPRWHVPASVTVPPGGLGAIFNAWRDPGAPWNGSVTITATWSGGSVTGKL